MECEMDRLDDVPSGAHRSDARGELNERYAHACPDTRIIDELARSPVVELGAGAGYWARLISDRGGDVFPFDNWSWDRGRPDHPWYEVETGDEELLERFTDRTLLMVMPRRPSEADRLIRLWRGDRLVVVTRGGFPLVDGLGWNETCIADGDWELVEERAMPEAVGTMVATIWRR